MSYCINPKCSHRLNPDAQQTCQACGTPLMVQQRYRLLEPLRALDEWDTTEIFEVDDGGQRRVFKILKAAKLLPHFQREAQTLQRVRHPGIPQVEPDGFFTIEVPAGQVHCLVMEKVAGHTLEQWLKEHGPISESLAVEWLGQMGEILHQIHTQGLFHRDIKLSNMMLRPQGQLVLIDFGTVRPVTNTYLAKIAVAQEVTSVVSPGYTPLEQINGKAVPQSDFYALGRSIVHLLTGQHPVGLPEDDQTGELGWQPSAPPLSPRLAQLIDQLIAPFPRQRPLSAQAILQQLAQLSASAPLAAQPLPQSALKRILQPSLRTLVALNVGLLCLNLLLGWYRFASPADTDQSYEAANGVSLPLANVSLAKFNRL
ncbi:protein kinase [Romeria aff. gracilis LEGE 07310]|uniref:non-specific serine/threonine protein kinase n=1 Tax=Vasconcelosia minhoensis LEGE 07310 TaxID=915328 RepID=A0A8J7DMS0_9CYAN|nr:serine/threonine-protein kinase [Romeria gracilis]MBE9079251.1 protein kinase [Romeria aff. gracilis LEGE 07310]